MLKNALLLTILFVIFLFIIISCQTNKKVVYEFPIAMAAPIRMEYEKISEKGRILYQINCAGCHNTKVKGKEIIPDFSPEQLKGYELRIANAKHEEALPETNITAEELGHIMTFLSYKIKNVSQVNK